MPAVAARVNTVRRESAGDPRSPRRTRVNRSPRSMFRRAGRLILIAITLAFLFGYVSVYANLTKTGFSRSKLTQMCRVERLRNERLKVEWIRHCSPETVVAAAEKSGMVYATEYEYVGQQQNVASAEH